LLSRVRPEAAGTLARLPTGLAAEGKGVLDSVLEQLVEGDRQGSGYLRPHLTRLS
jgi:hypothetical protein